MSSAPTPSVVHSGTPGPWRAFRAPWLRHPVRDAPALGPERPHLAVVAAAPRQAVAAVTIPAPNTAATTAPTAPTAAPAAEASATPATAAPAAPSAAAPAAAAATTPGKLYPRRKRPDDFLVEKMECRRNSRPRDFLVVESVSLIGITDLKRDRVHHHGGRSGGRCSQGCSRRDSEQLTALADRLPFETCFACVIATSLLYNYAG